MPAPATDLTFLSAPRISLAQFQRVLEAYNSPARGLASLLYGILVNYGIDPAIALAFFVHESNCGTRGAAKQTLNWGNLRRSQGRAYKVEDGWAWYRSWDASLFDWCELVLVYVHQGAGSKKGTPLPTVRAALAVYAPGDDDNDPLGYANTVMRLVAHWQVQDPEAVGRADVWTAWGDQYPLSETQRGWGIPQAWLAAGNLGAAIAPEIYAPDGSMSVQFFARGAIVYWADSKATTVVRKPKA